MARGIKHGRTRVGLDEGEPRGSAVGEPRDDGLSWDDASGGWTNKAGQRVCGGRLKQGRGRCAVARLRPNGRCRLHGGNMPVGLAHPNTTSGKYSSVLPSGLSERYAKFLQDPASIELRSNVALTDARIEEALHSMGGLGGLEVLEGAVEAWAQAEAARDLGDQNGFIAALDGVAKLLGEDGRSVLSGWKEVDRLQEQKRRLVAAESKRLKDAQGSMTPEEAALLVRFIVDQINATFRRWSLPEEARQELGMAIMNVFRRQKEEALAPPGPKRARAAGPDDDYEPDAEDAVVVVKK